MAPIFYFHLFFTVFDDHTVHTAGTPTMLAAACWAWYFANPCLDDANGALYFPLCDASSPLAEGATCTGGVAYPSASMSDVGPLLSCGSGGGGCSGMGSFISLEERQP